MGHRGERMSVVPNFDEIAWLRDNSPAWRLLRADNAPLVLSFLHRVFVADNIRSISAAELASRLDDELYALNERNQGRAASPKQAKAYLDDWAAPERRLAAQVLSRRHRRAALRRHPRGREGAAVGPDACSEREFVGTESRLNTIFELLRQIVFGTETDPAARIEELTAAQAAA